MLVFSLQRLALSLALKNGSLFLNFEFLQNLFSFGEEEFVILEYFSPFLFLSDLEEGILLVLLSPGFFFSFLFLGILLVLLSPGFFFSFLF